MTSARASIAFAATLILLGGPAAAAESPAGNAVETPAAATAQKASGIPAVPPVAQPAASADAPASETMVVTVNDVGISQTEFDRTWAYFMQRSGIPAGHAPGSAQMEELRKQVLDRLVDEELLVQESRRTNRLAGADAVEAEIAKAKAQFPSEEAFQAAIAQNKLTEKGLRALLQRNLSIQSLVEKEIAAAVTVTDAEVHDFYTGNADKFEEPEQVRARHILVKLDEKADQQAKAAAKAEAEGLLAQLKGGADFAELAKSSSDCPSASQGGDLGFFTRGQMVPPFEQAAFALGPEELSGVVETQFGYHIIKLEEKKGASKVEEQEVAQKIREYLGSRKTGEAVEQRLEKLREGAKIVVLMKF